MQGYDFQTRHFPLQLVSEEGGKDRGAHRSLEGRRTPGRQVSDHELQQPEIQNSCKDMIFTQNLQPHKVKVQLIVSKLDFQYCSKIIVIFDSKSSVGDASLDCKLSWIISRSSKYFDFQIYLIVLVLLNMSSHTSF
ncbi:Hypothetical_protein [Hexamita inflata]|uniref:Hypothetical_protein n=1 Tax=Hexamita inflata TaxID=28002 RepID=A0AA86QI72_9EUKA|nr:Hypothetical protein HINF_LOCUS44411 [Hexamita inflata]